MHRCRLLAVALVAAAAIACRSGDARRSVPEPQYVLTAEQTHNRFSRSIVPVLQVPLGAVVEVHTKEAVYFPVFVAGALLSIGDTHAAQGDGEVAGTGIEGPMHLVLELRVGKGGRRIAGPEYETDEYYAVTAFGTTLDEAARKAARYMIDHLAIEHHLTHAYAPCSLAGDLRVAEVVDVPHVLVSMHVPKRVLGI